MIFPRVAQRAAAVAGHYDELDPFYRDVWGDHVHHGLWRSGRQSVAAAADALVHLLAERLGLIGGERLCDVGCGYGRTAQLLADTYGVTVEGLTVSSVQFEVARSRAAVSPRLTFALQDWLKNGFADARFDCVFAIESSEHMPDKQAFFDEAYRTLRPGGRMAVFAWLARADAKPWHVDHLLEPICREGRLPSMGTAEEYRTFVERSGFEKIGFDDLTSQVRRTWSVSIRRLAAKLLTDSRYARYLFNPTSGERRFLLTLFRILLAYRTGAMRYGLLTARKPAHLTVGSPV